MGNDPTSEDPLLQPGKNCWRVERCQRAAFLVDGAAYFSAAAEAMLNARRAVYIVGWDIDSRIRLLRDGDIDGLPEQLGPFLDGLVSRRKGLEVYILDWDFAMLYALEREPLPIFRLGWNTHKRLHFKMDDCHPVGASHHQKLLVVDDKVAFCGGIDLASGRWDTPSHDPRDERRKDNGDPYPPFHDVQMMVDGDAARALGDLARQRWNRATGDSLEGPGETKGDPWPEQVSPDLEGVSVGILRTDPAYEENPAVREIKEFYLAAIARARSSIYIENQYLTARSVGEALASRLKEKDGPEVLLVLPRKCSGWLEEGTMGVLRARLLQRLRDADRFGRLRVCHPVVRCEGEQPVMVHAKVMVVDDRLVRIGSSNLNNRSMGYDTECDLAVEVENGEARERIADFRNRLLAEHLGAEPSAVADAIEKEGSLGAAVEALRGGKKSLEPIEEGVEEWLEELVPESQILDPEQPISLDELVDMLAPREQQLFAGGKKSRKGLVLGLVIVLALALAGLWRWTPLAEMVDVDSLAAWGTALRGNPIAPLVAVGVFVVGGLVLFPVTLLILAAALAFGPVAGFVYSLCGALASAMSTYGIGRVLGRDRVRSLAGGKLNRISRRLARSGLLTVAAVRMIPVAPYSVVNLVAGASHIRPRDFFFGTLIGMVPGTLAISLFEEGLVAAIKDPQIGQWLLLALLVTVFIGLGWLLRRWLQRRGVMEEGGEHE